MLKTSLTKQDIISLKSFYDSFLFTPKALTTSEFLNLSKQFQSFINTDLSKVFFTTGNNSIPYFYEYLSPDEQTFKHYSVSFSLSSLSLGFGLDLLISDHSLEHRLQLSIFVYYNQGLYYLDKWIGSDTQDIFNFDFTVPLASGFNFDDHFVFVKPSVLSQGSNIDSFVITYFHDIFKGIQKTKNNVVFTDYLCSKVFHKKPLYYLFNGQIYYGLVNPLASLVFNCQISGTVDSDGSRELSLKTCDIYQAIEIIGDLQADQDYIEQIVDDDYTGPNWIDPPYNYDCPAFEIDCEDCSQIEDLFKNVYSSLAFLASLIKSNINEGDDMDYTAQLTAINNSLQAIHSDLKATVEVEEGQTEEINITQAVVNISEEKDPLPIVISEGVTGLKAIPFDKINNI